MGSEKKEEFKITEDEVKKIGEALKDEQFRKLFLEYAEEIQNPENRKLYEQEIAQLEQERGMNVQFVHPQPGHVIKTSVNGDMKAFINICQNDKIGKPIAKREVSKDGKSGINWSIPHSHTPPREDLDKQKQKCKIYDVVFHPDTYRMAETNSRFRKLVEDTAVDGIEQQFGVKIDGKNIKHPKLKYKGTPTATVIRTKSDEPAKTLDDNDPIKNMPYPFDDKTSEQKAKDMKEAVKKKQAVENKKASQTKTPKKEEPNETVPKYTITHRSDMDLQEFTNSPDSRPSTRPKELVISIELPLLSSAKPIDLDIFEQKLVLQSKEPAAYKLDLKLPYKVDEDQGSAKFDKSKHCLVVTLPVLPEKIPTIPTKVEEEKSEEKENENTDKPLIEVLSASNSSSEDYVKVQKSEEVSTRSLPVYQNHLPKISHSLPSFTYSQDSETVTFVFSVKNIVIDSVNKLFPLPNVCHIKFMSRGSGGFPQHYSFMAKFSAKNCFVPEHCSFDITPENSVLLLLKEKNSRHNWDMFQAGICLDELQDFVFPTEKTLKDNLDELVSESEINSNNSNNQEKIVEVTEMTKKKLSIKIQNKNKQENVSNPQETVKPVSTDNSPKVVDADDELDEEEECPSSADIEVVHTKCVPNLHGILKQRSLSESSEDQSLSASSGSPESPREDLFRKSVKFNDRIDQATYKTKAAVTAMTQTLKSKRRRNRKKEEKRSRKNSGSSEGSSDEHRFSDDHTVEKIEEIANEEVEDEEELSVDAMELEGCDEKSLKTPEDHAAIHKKELKAEIDSHAKQEKIVCDIKNKLAISNDEGKCDSDDEIDNDITVEIPNKAKLKKESKKENVDNNKNDATRTENNLKEEEEEDENTITVTSDLIQKPSDLTNIIGDGANTIVKIKAATNTNGEDSGVECCEGSGDKGDKSNTDTVLSWNEDITSQDHRTDCAFQFSNAVIYDLDID